VGQLAAQDAEVLELSRDSLWKCAPAFNRQQSKRPHQLCLDRLNIDSPGRRRRVKPICLLWMYSVRASGGVGAQHRQGTLRLHITCVESQDMTGRGDTGQGAQGVWLLPGFPLGEDSAQKDRKSLSIESLDGNRC
jgi:hypothetical protein